MNILRDLQEDLGMIEQIIRKKKELKTQLSGINIYCRQFLRLWQIF